jgi:hypothetical protein
MHNHTPPKGAEDSWPRDSMGVRIEKYLADWAGTAWTTLGLAQYMGLDVAVVQVYVPALAREHSSPIQWSGTSRAMDDASPPTSYTYYGVPLAKRRP